jgi:hypothetical protein
MKSTPHLLFSVGFSVLLSNSHVWAAPLERTVSTSRQFIVYGVTTPLRGAVAGVAEKTKSDLLRLLQQRDGWTTPIILNLQFPQANIPDVPASALYFSQTGAGLKLQLDLTITADLDVVALRRQLLRAIVLEMIYRHQPDLPAGSIYIEPPSWLIEGVLATEPQQDRAELVEALQPIIAAKKVIPLEEFLHQNPALLDSAGQRLHRAYSLVLLELLLDEPNSPARLASYIANFSQSSPDASANLKAQFPVLTGANDNEVLWQAKVANAGAARDYELLTGAETEQRLDVLISSGIASGAESGKRIRLDDLLSRKLSKSEAAEVRRLGQDLMALSTRANPVLRPLIIDYQQLLQRLSSGKRKGIDAQFARIESRRRRMKERMSNIDDYMNWFEATKSGSRSGAFAGFRRAADGANESRPRRHDPLSVYLDALEGQF